MIRALGAGAMALALGMSASAQSPTGAPDEWPQHLHGAAIYGSLIVDQLEYWAQDGDDALRWEAIGSLGGDTHRLWVEASGDWTTTRTSEGELELQALASRALTPFWDLRIGVRQDLLFGPGAGRDRTFAVLDVTGLAPLWIELTPALFVSGEGDLSARVTAIGDVQLTQSLVAEPRFELNAAAHQARGLGIRPGLTDLELALRVRWEWRPELAPYVGVHWERELGPTAIVARRGGEGASAVGVVMGLRFWY